MYLILTVYKVLKATITDNHITNSYTLIVQDQRLLMPIICHAADTHCTSNYDDDDYYVVG